MQASGTFKWEVLVTLIDSVNQRWRNRPSVEDGQRLMVSNREHQMYFNKCMNKRWNSRKLL